MASYRHSTQQGLRAATALEKHFASCWLCVMAHFAKFVLTLDSNYIIPVEFPLSALYSIYSAAASKARL
jgi:hypothetical protein